jgi:PAS domain S-box-containing protein
MKSDRQTLGAGIAVVIAYVATAQLGFRVALVAEQVTTVWPPTGIAQATLLLAGLRLWPAIWIGAFIANVTSSPILVAAAIATGNTLEACAAAWALQRVPGFDASLRRTRDALAYMLFATVGSCTIGATVGATTLCASGLQSWARFGSIWADWAIGDMMGSLIVGTAIVTAVRQWPRLRHWRVRETIGLLVLTLLITQIIFGGLLTTPIGLHPLEFVIFPLVIAAAVRLGQPATSLIVLAASTITILNTMKGIGPFGSEPMHTRLILLQAFMAVLASSGMVLAAAIAERHVAERRRAAAHAVGQVLAGAADLDEAAPHILAAVCRHLEWPVGALWTIDDDRQTLRCRCTWAAAGNGEPFVTLTRQTTFTRGVGLPGRVWAQGEPSWIEDVVIDSNFPRAAAARDARLHGAFGVPIRLGNELLGVAEFFHHRVTSPDADLLATMAAVGTQIGQFMMRKRVEHALREGESRIRAIVETAPDAIINMDADGRITDFNAAAERTFGHRREDVLGRELATLLIPEELRAAHHAGLKRLASSQTPFAARRLESTAVHADGHHFPVELSISAIMRDGQRMFTGFVRDVTGRRRAEDERRRLLEGERLARREAEVANRAKDDFLATLSHELRTPLNAIVGWTRMLLDGTVDKAHVQRALEVIDRNAHAQVQLVNDLLDVSRIITGGLRLDVQAIDLGQVIAAAVDAVRPAADAKQISLKPVVAPSARAADGDATRLQQIVWNLLANAVKFTPQGGSIQVALLDVGTHVRIEVKDSGPGIEIEFLPHVFERFRQADSSFSRRHGGLGLGLAIVRHLVELHGGTVRAESEGPGHGAAFIVELPRSLRALEIRTTETVRQQETTSGNSTPSADLTGCRVLVVEDDEDALTLVATVLKGAGASVRATRSVGEAVRALEAEWPDVLLADLGLPDEDGCALIRKVRVMERGTGTRLPAAAISAYGREQDRNNAIAEGFDRHLAKPVEPGQILALARVLWQRADPPIANR